MNDKIQVVFEEKQGKKYVETWKCEDTQKVYEDLAHELIAKKINKCTYIRSITRCQLYNGFIKIYVRYDNGGQRIYTINDH